jgi:tripartite-type tricarboxylate transporter receptor subunit TctC
MQREIRFLRRCIVLSAAAAVAAVPLLASAQGATAAFPQKPVRIVVPYPPGGTNDVLARVLAQKLQDAWGQPVVVENKPGAAGNIGAAEVAKAVPDGHTLLLTNINITSMNPALVARMPFDAQKDFAPISLLGTTAMALVVHPNVPVKSAQELIRLLREKPGRMSYASSGNGSPQHMSAEMFKAMTATRIVHIPYRGAAPAVTDVVAGQVEMTFGVVNQLLPHIRSGKLRPLAVTTSKRLPSLPDVPTLDESGVKGYESEIWLGLAAPAGTPAAVIERINQDVRKAMSDPEVVTRLAGQGVDVLVSSPEQMRERAAQDLKRWSAIIKTSGIKAE